MAEQEGKGIAGWRSGEEGDAANTASSTEKGGKGLMTWREGSAGAEAYAELESKYCMVQNRKGELCGSELPCAEHA